MRFFKIHIFIILPLLILKCQAQPGWVQEAIDRAAAFPIDEAASEVILHETKEVHVMGHERTRIQMRRAVKVMKPSDKWPGAVREWKSTNRTINGLKGWHVGPNGIETLDDKDIVEFSISELRGYYDESHVLVAGFPNIASGDVVAYEYTVHDNDWSGIHQRYSFQIQQPVCYAQFSIEVPDNWLIHKSEWNIDSVVFERRENRYSWTVRNLQFRPEEPLMPPWSFLERQIDVSAYDATDEAGINFSDWSKVARWTKNLCDPAVTVTDAIRREVDQLTSGSPDDTLQKIRLIADYVRDRIRYVAVEIGKGRWEPRQASSTLYDRYGDCKDKTTLMRAMLAAAGIPSSLALANTSFYVDSVLPSPFQFNHAIIAVPLSVLNTPSSFDGAISGKWLFFDPTDEVNPLGALPIPLQGNRVLVAAEDDAVLVRLPYARADENQRLYRADITVEQSTSINAKVHVVDRGVYSHYVRHYLKSTAKEKQIESLQRSLAATFGDCTVSDYLSGQHGDSVWTSFRVNAENGLKQTNNMVFLKPDFFQTAEFPVFAKPTRLYPIWFGGPRRIDTEINFQIPRGWRIQDEALPSAQSSCKDVAEISYRITAKPNALHLVAHRANSGGLLDVSDYEIVKAFGHDVRAYHQLMLILHSK